MNPVDWEDIFPRALQHLQSADSFYFDLYPISRAEGCKLSNAQLKVIVDTIRTNADKLKILHISSGLLGDPEAKMLAEALVECQNIEQVSLSLNNIGDKGVEALVTALTGKMQLNSLYLDGNLITAQGAAYIAKLIPTTPEISSVMLGQNELGDEGVLCLSPKLTAPTIKRLNLNENRITDIGACALGRDLANHPNMWDMQIANNHIGDQGVVELMSAVRTMPKIQKIKLGANDFGTIGAEAIARAFNLSSLNYVNLQDMIFDDRALRALKQAESTAKETMGLAKIHLGSSQPSAIPQAPAASLAVGINNRPPPYSHS